MTRAEEKSIEWQLAHHPKAIGGDSFADYLAQMNINPAFVDGYKEGQKDLTERACEYITHYCNRTGISPVRRAEFLTKFREVMEVEA